MIFNICYFSINGNSTEATFDNENFHQKFFVTKKAEGAKELIDQICMKKEDKIDSVNYHLRCSTLFKAEPQWTYPTRVSTLSLIDPSIQ